MIEEILSNVALRDAMVLSSMMILLNVIFDELQQHSEENKWKMPNKALNNWLNEKTSWRNKHTWGDKWGLPKWVFGSALVFATDGEHFFQLMKRMCILIIPCLFLSFWLFPLFMLIQNGISWAMNEKFLK